MIPDFMGSIWESLQGFPAFWLRSCSDFGFHGVNLGIAARITRVLALGLQRFLISGGKLANRCRVLPVYTLLRAVILDFRPRLGNRCKLFPV